MTPPPCLRDLRSKSPTSPTRPEPCESPRVVYGTERLYYARRIETAGNVPGLAINNAAGPNGAVKRADEENSVPWLMLT